MKMYFGRGGPETNHVTFMISPVACIAMTSTTENLHRQTAMKAFR